MYNMAGKSVQYWRSKCSFSPEAVFILSGFGVQGKRNIQQQRITTERVLKEKRRRTNLLRFSFCLPRPGGDTHDFFDEAVQITGETWNEPIKVKGYNPYSAKALPLRSYNNTPQDRQCGDMKIVSASQPQ